METAHFDTLSLAIDGLTKEGYTDGFKAEADSIVALYAKRKYQPEDLKITHTFRFEGMTNPADATEVFAIVANDGLKGTLVMSYSAVHFQNVELIKRIEQLK